MSKKLISIVLIAATAMIGFILINPDKDGMEIPENTPIAASTETERISYFASHGWDVDEISSKDITIPADFSEEYSEYAALQDRQGMPLREYAGKSGKLYVYEVRNYSPSDSRMLAELLVCDGTAVASLVYSDNGDGKQLSVN